MNRSCLSFVLAVALLASPAFAQSDARVEISVNGGYTLSEGVDVSEQTVIGLIVSEVNPKSAGSYNINASFFMSEQAQVGFLFGRGGRSAADVPQNRFSPACKLRPKAGSWVRSVVHAAPCRGRPTGPA